MIDRTLNRISTVTAMISGATLLILMVMITVDAVGRKLGYPLPGSLELSEAMMVIIVYLALFAVQYHRENVFVSIVTHQLSERKQALLDMFAALIGVALFALLAWMGWLRAMDAYRMGEYRVAAIIVPIWPFRFAIPLGLSLLCVQLMVTAIQDWRRTRPARADYLPEV